MTVQTLITLLAVIWASPYTLLGLFLGSIGLCTGGRGRIIGRVVEFYGGGVKWLLHRFPDGQFTLALTLGHTVLGQGGKVEEGHGASDINRDARTRSTDMRKMFRLGGPSPANGLPCELLPNMMHVQVLSGNPRPARVGVEVRRAVAVMGMGLLGRVRPYGMAARECTHEDDVYARRWPVPVCA
jgi:hypothetical protein